MLVTDFLADSPQGDLSEWTSRIPERERTGVLASVWCTCLLFCTTLTLADPDLWGHTLYGLRALDQGVLTEKHDPFSYTAPNADWINHEWLSEYQYGWLWQRAGNLGLVAWKCAMFAVVMVVIGLALRQSRCGAAAGVFLLVLTAETLADFVVFVRPQLATFALFAVTLWVLNRHRDAPSWRTILWLPALTVLWVNSHGGFLAGLGLQAVFGCEAAWQALRQTESWRRFRMLAAVGGLSLLATFVNPYGAQLHAMLWYHLGTPQDVREWQSLWAAQQSPIYYAPFLLVAVAAVGWRRWRLVDVLVIAVVGLQAFLHIRHVALLAIAVAVLLPGPLTHALHRLFPQIIEHWSQKRMRSGRVASICLVLAFLALLQVRGSAPLWRAGIPPWEIAVETQSDVPGMPMAALRRMQAAGLSGQLVTDYGWGQVALWHLYPQVRVAFDGRYRTVYPAELERAFLDVSRGVASAESDRLLDRMGTDLALFAIRHPARTLFVDRPGWSEVYRDRQAVLYVKQPHNQRKLVLTAFTEGNAEEARWEPFPGARGTQGPAALLAASRRVSEQEMH